MDRWESQYQFWASFGVPAYEENSVPDEAEVSYPYITFPRVLGGFGGRTNVTPSIYDKSFSWERADALANAVYNALENGGATIDYDGGQIWIIRDDDNFANGIGNPDDDMIRRLRLSVFYDFS